MLLASLLSLALGPAPAPLLAASPAQEGVVLDASVVTQEPASAPAGPPFPPGVVARWKGGELGEARYDRFLGRSFHRKPLGQEALQHLLQIQLVEGEAERLGIGVAEGLVDQRVQEAYDQADEAGMDLTAALKARGLSPESFRALMRDALLHEELVRRELGLGPAQTPSPEQQEAWSQARLQELMGRAVAAPEGYAIDSPPYQVTLQQLGEAIRAALPPGRQREYIEQLVLQIHLADWATRNRVVLGEEVLHAEIEWRRRHVAENPAFGGMSYEQLLQSQGSSVESVKTSEELRTAGYLRLLAADRYPDAWFDALSAEDRVALEGQNGETRKVRWLLLRAVETKTDPLDLDFEEAAAELEAFRQEVGSEADFERLAGELSEHEVSRLQGGMLGWVHQYESSVDLAVCQAAFGMEAGECSPPVRVGEGVALVYLSEIRPRPEEATFRALVRRSRHQELRKEILTQIALELR